MKRTVFIVVLAASLAFNVFFAIGLYRAQEAPRSMAERTKAFAEELGLSPEQRIAYDQWADRCAVQRRERVTKFREAFDRAVDELIKDSPDESVIDAYVRAASGDETRRTNIENLRELMALLTPEQRVKIVQLFRASRRPLEKTDKPADTAKP